MELIAEYGLHITDKYLLMASRLDIDQNMVDIWKTGNDLVYDFEATPNGPVESASAIMVKANMNKLYGAIAANRYTEMLAGLDLWRVTFITALEEEEIVPAKKWKPASSEFKTQLLTKSILTIRM